MLAGPGLKHLPEVKRSKPNPESVIIQITLNKLFYLYKGNYRHQTSPGPDLDGPGRGVGLKMIRFLHTLRQRSQNLSSVYLPLFVNSYTVFRCYCDMVIVLAWKLITT